MRVCFPTEGNAGLEERVGEHFGRVPTYTIVDTESDDVEIISNDSTHQGGKGLPANLLAQEGVDVMICSGLGRKAINLFEEHGIEVCIGAGGRVKEALEEWRNDHLKSASQSDACERHEFGGHGHNDNH
ncbi:NifB/NifX family molybdenum-iron cluster-binding protein [Candidatus Bipolaricaulota bacterium]|nr:NifB/NifX family molybdenum-iron cluster-binding protein [Candidatus Bipolaricaulota bacterium]